MMIDNGYTKTNSVGLKQYVAYYKLLGNDDEIRSFRKVNF